LALRNTPPEAMDRGMVLAPADAPLRVLDAGKPISGRLRRSAFSRQPLKAGSVGSSRPACSSSRCDSPPTPPARQEAPSKASWRSARARSGERAILWHVDAAPQRVVGRVVLP